MIPIILNNAFRIVPVRSAPRLCELFRRTSRNPGYNGAARDDASHIIRTSLAVALETFTQKKVMEAQRKASATVLQNVF